MVELGPSGTGKSFAYQELSPYVILLTGPTTVANLFYNMATGKMGLVGLWDAVAFDEVADLQKDAEGSRDYAKNLLRIWNLCARQGIVIGDSILRVLWKHKSAR